MDKSNNLYQIFPNHLNKEEIIESVWLLEMSEIYSRILDWKIGRQRACELQVALIE